MSLLRLARRCNPLQVIDIKPTIDDLNELRLFKFYHSSIWIAFYHSSKDTAIEELVHWGLFVSLLAAQQVNSAGAERVFFVLKQAFHELQAGSLCEQSSGENIIAHWETFKVISIKIKWIPSI